MNEYELVSDYRHNKVLREQFNELVKVTFGIDFSVWYEKGYWNETYIPYSFIDNGKVIANASVYKMSVVINDLSYDAIQIGTVMTDKLYRNKGLAKRLMDHIIEEYKGSCDFMYLFANESVLDFYPKLGFVRIDESEYRLNVNNSNTQRETSACPRKLSVEDDLAILERFATNRLIGHTLDVKNNKELLMFYFVLVFSEAIYYIEELETIVLMEQDEDILHVYDLISLKEQEMELILSHFCLDSTKSVVLHFTPEKQIVGMDVQVVPADDDALFVIGNAPFLNNRHVKFPLTSHC
ncbi:GNAT family N-acetyltransferase [Shouchella patagoniensis]|uniref:GNAT family N-acetyltransferase n=1 Tax=Shouchella patagoniensis TaxID=228576 RepID=UPI000994CBF7|nr:GNAT family N-acetyltransferase [Shouchella patagoniensis]